MSSKPSDQNTEGRAQAGGAATGGTLGEQLRRAREQRGISLREISDQTRISMRHLEAIEADDYKHLPGGIFNRSFIKAYARIIKFDESAALEAYARTAREHGEAPDEVPTSPTRSRVYMDGDANRSPLVTALLSALILGVLIVGVYASLQWYRRSQGGAGGAQANVNATAPSGSAPVANQSAPQTGAANGPAAGTPTAASAPGGGLRVQVKARGEEVWIGASMDEQKLPPATLKADETREFTPQNRLSISYSKSKRDAVEVTINGQVAQTPPPGKNGLVEWVITKDDYKQFLP